MNAGAESGGKPPIHRSRGVAKSGGTRQSAITSSNCFAPFIRAIALIRRLARAAIADTAPARAHTVATWTREISAGEAK